MQTVKDYSDWLLYYSMLILINEVLSLEPVN